MFGSPQVIQFPFGQQQPTQQMPIFQPPVGSPFATGTYAIKFDKKNNVFHLEAIPNFSLPSKIYGNSEKLAMKIINTYKDRKNSTGVMAEGERGSGKSLLAKMIATYAQRELGIHTYVVTEDFCGEVFNFFVQSLPPAVIIFDEFEKVYANPHKQQQLLTLLDGVFSSKKLFVFTCNQTSNRIDPNMINRPGRIYYSIKYAGLSKQFITDYCNDNLWDKSKITAICDAASIFRAFNFDMLSALVEELNRYGESVKDTIAILNMTPTDGGVRYNYSVVEKTEEGEKAIPPDDYSFIRTHPLATPEISVSIPNPGRMFDSKSIKIVQSMLVKADVQTSTYIYSDGHYTVTFVQKVDEQPDAFRLLAE